MGGKLLPPGQTHCFMNQDHDRTAWLKGGTASCLHRPRKVERPYHLVLLGAPGVGKGTQAELLCEHLGACHLSTGDVFRAAKSHAAHENSPAMSDALDYMRRGELVPDDTVLSLIRERMRCLHCIGGFLLDGFPRTVAQAEVLEQLLRSENLALSAVIDYELPLVEVITRLSGRRTCPDCKATFHLTSLPPRVPGICDHCLGKLIQREDDRPESIRVRMLAYNHSTQPLIEFYRQRELLHTIPAIGSPQEIFLRTIAEL